MAPAPRGLWPAWAFGACVALAFAAYHWLYFLAPRLLGSSDPDRFFHLALSRLIAENGLPKLLPQVEDLGWGRYFPDKEFLFHALTGSAWAVGGEPAVLLLVPLLGIAIALCLYLGLRRPLPPGHAALVAIAVPLVSVGFMFRLSLLRPHLLAILIFCCLLVAIVRDRPRLAALAAALFALSYHAFYMVGIVVLAAWLLRRQPGMPARGWAWCLAGLVAGLILNPYFPSNVEMGILTLRLALGLEAAPFVDASVEIRAMSPRLMLAAYAFLPLTLAAAALGALIRKPAPGEERSAFLFLFLVTLVCTGLALKSMRAIEYAVPAGILLVGYSARVLRIEKWLPLAVGLLLGCQLPLAFQFYQQSWKTSPQSPFPAYQALLQQIPATGKAAKVFNCEWETGSYIFMARPDLRFVDLLEPALLWNASQTKYLARQGLIQGAFDDPRKILRGAFNADYVLCSKEPLIRQMDERPGDFRSARGTRGDQIRLFAVRPD